MNKYGFNNRVYPKKHWICTEYNVPRKRFGEYMGSDLAQINFVIKSLVTAQVQGVAQMHLYSLADDQPEATATGEFAYMGLFKNLNGVKKGEAVPNLVAFALHTTTLLLDSTRYDSIQTSRLNIPKTWMGPHLKNATGNLCMYYGHVHKLIWKKPRKAVLPFQPLLNLKNSENSPGTTAKPVNPKYRKAKPCF